MRVPSQKFEDAKSTPAIDILSEPVETIFVRRNTDILGTSNENIWVAVASPLDAASN
jgi:hypothetical protein